MRGNTNKVCRIRFPNLFRIRFAALFARQRPKHEIASDGDASAFFEGCMKYDEVHTDAFDVLDYSFLSSNSRATPVSVSSCDSGSDGSSGNEKGRIACCVDDYMESDDFSLDQSSTVFVSSQHSSIVENNNIGTIYTIIDELVAEHENGLKFNRMVDPSKDDRRRGTGVSFSMNCSVFSGKNSGIFSTATPFCIFKDDASVLTYVHEPQRKTAKSSPVLPNKCDRPETSSSPEFWSINWTEMIDDSDCSNCQDGMLMGGPTEWVIQNEKPNESFLRLDEGSPEMGDGEPTRSA